MCLIATHCGRQDAVEELDTVIVCLIQKHGLMLMLIVGADADKHVGLLVSETGEWM